MFNWLRRLLGFDIVEPGETSPMVRKRIVPTPYKEPPPRPTKPPPPAKASSCPLPPKPPRKRGTM